MLAQKLPERPAVLLHGRRGTSDVPVVHTKNRREKVVLESPNDTGFHCSERLIFRGRSLIGQVKIAQVSGRMYAPG